MLFKSTFLQSSSIWKVMSALFITVRDAWRATRRQYYPRRQTHIAYQLCVHIWILIKNTGDLIDTWHRWFKDVCRFRIWENLLDTENTKYIYIYSYCSLKVCVWIKMRCGEKGGFCTCIQIWCSSGFPEDHEVLFLATRQAVWQIFW